MTPADRAAGRSLIFLVGFMGAGKTTVGERLAEELNWDFADTDQRVEALSGMTIDGIFESRGEGGFRALEAEVLAELAGRERCVVATGGGLFLGRAQRTLMKARGFTVWLDLSLAAARARVGDGAGRPLWAAEDRLGQRAVFEKRRASYALAHLRVGADAAPAAALARGIKLFFIDSGGKLVIDRRGRNLLQEDSG